MTDWRMALGVVSALGLGLVGVAVLPPMLVPGEPALDTQISAALPGASTADIRMSIPGSAEGPRATALAPEPMGPASSGAGPSVASPQGGGAASDVAPEPDSELRDDLRAASPVPVIPSAPFLPSFDTVRVEPDGSSLVAGQAEPGTTVSVVTDGDVAAEATADEDGRFVAFLDLAPSPQPRELLLRDGTGALSDETVIVAPSLPGQQVAAVAPAPLVRSGPPAVDPEAPAADAVQGQEAVQAVPDAGPAVSEAALPEESAASADATPAREAPTPSGGSAEGGGLGAYAVAEGGGDSLGDDEAPPVPAADGSSVNADDLASLQGEAVDAALQGADRGNPAPPAPALAAPLDADDSASGDMPGRAVAIPEVADLAPAPPAPLAQQAPGQEPVLLSDTEGVRVLQPALAPGASSEVLATVALDAIAYDGTGEVILSGRATDAGAVRLYLDNAPMADVAIDANGTWSTPLTGTEPGVYTLRVDQLDAQGAVVSRIETPFQREDRSSLETVLAEAGRLSGGIALRTVQPGNTLWAIARERYGEPLLYLRVFEANRDRIRNPDLIYPGQVFVLPELQ